MASLSKGYAFNAGKRDPLKSRAVTYKGERRAEKWPSGRVDRFVDLHGNVVFRQLVAPGVPPTEERINAARNRAHADSTIIHGDLIQGFIEHGKCPLKHGVRYLTPALEAEFSAMPESLQRPCSDEKPTATRGAKGSIELHDGCCHIDWLIKSRRDRALNERLMKRKLQIDHQAEQLKLAKQQIDATNKVNERLISAVEGMTGKARKAPNE